MIVNKFNGYSPDGRRLYYIGGGGGGSTTQVVDVPEWAKPYAKDVLARSSAMTMPGEEGVSEAPKYGGQRVAGLQPLGVFAKDAAAGLTIAPQLGAATTMAQGAGQYGMGAEQAYRNLSAGDISGLRGAGAQLGQQLQPGIQYGMGAGERLEGKLDPALQASLRAGERLEGIIAPGVQAAMGAGQRFEGRIDPALQAALGAGTAYGQMATDPGSMQAYMSPYMQNVVDIEKREAQRQADIAATGRGAQAVRAGAFGGSRQAILEAEAQRNLQQQLGDIQSRGLQSAFERAQQAQQFGADVGLRGIGQGLQAQQAAAQLGLSGIGQGLQAQQAAAQLGLSGLGQGLQAQQAAAQLGLSGVGQSMQAQQAAADLGLRGTQAALAGTQFGSTLGMQGAQLANQAAQNLGQLGATQFGQQKDIIGIQSQLGKDEQALEQARMDVAYQDWVDEQKYPYQQLGFMADMLRGVPVGQTATTIGPAPSPVSQALGLAGTAYYGSKAFGVPGRAEGGLVPGYASGGISSLNPIQRDVALSKPGMDSPQLQGLMGLADISQIAKLQVEEKLQQNAKLRRAAEMAQAAQQPQPQTSVAQEALMEMGLGGLDVPEDMVSAAGGGIIGYAEGTDEEGVQTGSPFRRAVEGFGDTQLGKGLKTAGLMPNVDEESKILALRTALVQKYFESAGIPGAFENQSDEERRRATEILNNLDSMSIKEMEQALYDATPATTASVAQQSASQAPDDTRPVLASVPESGTVLTEAQRKNLQNSENVRYSTVPPQTPTQEEKDEAALIAAERAGKAPGTDYGRPQYTTGNAPTFVSPVTPKSYLATLEKAMAPGMAQIEQGFADEEAANKALIDEIKKAETQRQADVTAAGEYGADREKRAEKRLEEIKGRKEDAKLNFIRDISVGLLTSSTGNFLTDLGVAVGKGGKAYDATVERIDAAKEKLQDSIDTIMDQRRGERITNAKSKSDAAAALAKAKNDLAKTIANKRTTFGNISMKDARSAVDQATSMAMTAAERQHATQLAQYAQQQAASREAAKPEGRDALQARITTMLADPNPAVRAQGRRLRDGLKEVTDVATFRTAPGQITQKVSLDTYLKKEEEVRKQVTDPTDRVMQKRIKGMTNTELEAFIRKTATERAQAATEASQGVDVRAPTDGQGGMSYADVMKK